MRFVSIEGADIEEGIPEMPRFGMPIPPKPNESVAGAIGLAALAPAEASFSTSARKESELCMVVPPRSTRTPGFAVFISATYRASS
eukprot:scaffold254913_cov35-Tisochrysis_lutea.AAC.2